MTWKVFNTRLCNVPARCHAVTNAEITNSPATSGSADGTELMTSWKTAVRTDKAK